MLAEKRRLKNRAIGKGQIREPANKVYKGLVFYWGKN